MPPRLVTAAVWTTFAACALSAAAFVAALAGPVPTVDDLIFLDVWLDPHFPGLAKLWEPLNEHHLPLPKLLTWLTGRALGVDLRLMMALDLAALVGSTAFLMRAVARARGGTRLADVFLPLTLLSVGHAQSLLWAVQVNFYAPLVLSLLALARLVALGPVPTRADALVVGVAALGLALSGVHGAAVAGPLAAWLLVVAADRRVGGAARLVAAGFALAALALVAAALLDRGPVPLHAPPRLDAAALRYAVRLAGGGLGPAAADLPAPWDLLAGLAVTIVVAVSLRNLARDPARVRALGLAAFALGFVALALVVAAGRAEMQRGALANRYLTLMLPLAAWAYAAGPGRSQAALAVAALALAWPNAAEGLRLGRAESACQAAAVADIRRGLPAAFVDEHHQAYLFAPQVGVAGPRLERLRQAGVEPFARMAAPVELAAKPLTWEAVTAGGAGRTQMTIRFAGPLDCDAIRIDYELINVEGPIDTEARWDTPGGAARVVRQPLLPWMTTRRLWLGRGVREVRLVVRGPATLRVTGVAGLE